MSVLLSGQDDDADEQLATRTAARLVLVENTPTPFLNRKYAKTTGSIASAKNPLATPNPARYIPNTPAIGNRHPSLFPTSSATRTPSHANQVACATPSTLSRKLKKLYDANMFLNDEDDLPGVPPVPPPQQSLQTSIMRDTTNTSNSSSANLIAKSTTKTRKSKSGKLVPGEKASSIFRPKVATPGIDDATGCELSFGIS